MSQKRTKPGKFIRERVAGNSSPVSFLDQEAKEFAAQIAVGLNKEESEKRDDSELGDNQRKYSKVSVIALAAVYYARKYSSNSEQLKQIPPDSDGYELSKEDKFPVLNRLIKDLRLENKHRSEKGLDRELHNIKIGTMIKLMLVIFAEDKYPEVLEASSINPDKVDLFDSGYNDGGPNKGKSRKRA